MSTESGARAPGAIPVRGDRADGALPRRGPRRLRPARGQGIPPAHHSRSDASRAPSASAANLAHTILGSTWGNPAKVENPQSEAKTQAPADLLEDSRIECGPVEVLATDARSV